MARGVLGEEVASTGRVCLPRLGRLESELLRSLEGRGGAGCPLYFPPTIKRKGFSTREERSRKHSSGTRGHFWTVTGGQPRRKDGEGHFSGARCLRRPLSHRWLPRPGSPGRPREPRVISAGGVWDPWPPLGLKYLLPSGLGGGAARIGPGPLPFLERPSRALFRGASGEGASSRVCVARTARVTPFSCRR